MTLLYKTINKYVVVQDGFDVKSITMEHLWYDDDQL
jgi:hypothetical protein